MSSLLDELEQSWNAPSLVPGGLPPLPNQPPASMVEELEATWEPAPADVTANMPGVGSGVLAIKNWLQRNPQFALDIAAQTIATGAGIAGGSPAGIPGMMAGGAAGNVLGKQASRRVGQALNFPDAEPPPNLTSAETAVDAGLGALGPAVQPLARMGGRALTGLNKGQFDKAVTRAHGQLDADASAELNKLLVNMTPDELMRTYVGQVPRAVEDLIARTQGMRGLEVDNAALNAVASAQARTAAQRGTEPGRRVRTGMGSALAGAALSAEPVTGALIAAGASDIVVSRVVPYLLSQPNLGLKIARWALDVSPKTPGAARTSLAAIVANETLTREQRTAVDELSASLGGQTRTDATYDPNVDRHRTPDGRFHGGPVRHGDRPDGSHDDESDEQ